MSKNIFVFVEQRGGSIQKVSLELIGEATRLAADLGEAVVAVLMGHNIADIPCWRSTPPSPTSRAWSM